MRQVVIVTVIILLAGCDYERRTEVTLVGGNPPVFTMAGSGVLAELVFYGPQAGRPDDLSRIVWDIVPAEMRGESVEVLRTVTYGVVPKGYKQTSPENGHPPETLVSGSRYRYWFVTGEAPGAIGFFQVVD